jgi:hypothetical protein
MWVKCLDTKKSSAIGPEYLETLTILMDLKVMDTYAIPGNKGMWNWEDRRFAYQVS